MKKFILTTMAALTFLFAQAQTPCDSLIISGSQYQLTITSTGIIDFWETTAPDGSILGQDSSSNMHSVYINPSSGSALDTISTCLYTMNTVCCVIYIWNGSNWITSGSSTPSWDCSPNTLLGCYDPGTGNGQYTTLSSCQSICGNVTDSFACMGGIAPGITTCVGPGVFTMGQTYVMSVYSTIAACIADSCNVMPLPPTWDCSPNLLGCYDPGTGLGQYTTLSSCQFNCSNTPSNYCDSMTASGSQFQITMGINNINTIIDYWVTTTPNGSILQEDSITNTHTIYQNTQGMPYDTIITCITYPYPVGYFTCCVTWVWNGSFWAKMGSVISVGDLNSTEKKLLKVTDLFGRETKGSKNEPLFYIYDDGTVEKKIIIE
jgi:hypothetical protein